MPMTYDETVEVAGRMPAGLRGARGRRLLLDTTDDPKCPACEGRGHFGDPLVRCPLCLGWGEVTESIRKWFNDAASVDAEPKERRRADPAPFGLRKLFYGLKPQPRVGLTEERPLRVSFDFERGGRAA